MLWILNFCLWIQIRGSDWCVWPISAAKRGSRERVWGWTHQKSSGNVTFLFTVAAYDSAGIDSTDVSMKIGWMGEEQQQQTTGSVMLISRVLGGFFSLFHTCTAVL